MLQIVVKFCLKKHLKNHLLIEIKMLQIVCHCRSHQYIPIVFIEEASIIIAANQEIINVNLHCLLPLYWELILVRQCNFSYKVWDWKTTLKVTKMLHQLNITFSREGANRASLETLNEMPNTAFSFCVFFSSAGGYIIFHHHFQGMHCAFFSWDAGLVVYSIGDILDSGALRSMNANTIQGEGTKTEQKFINCILRSKVWQKFSNDNVLPKLQANRADIRNLELLNIGGNDHDYHFS